ncbi:MAG TPA: DUF427 domain-containing protein [Bryobacteraceae bacterium]|mgnify:CR=1 FL=1|jgi:uncharacterized protein (DUF427 family)|nr:DUF427 domain-containing protein [Bryobacteraceae bacterium]
MARAIWEGAILAESDNCLTVEGNYYFPPDSLQRRYFEPTSEYTICPWKGRASYYHVIVDGKKNANAAWYYPKPSAAARNIKDHVAFWRGVRVEE